MKQPSMLSVLFARAQNVPQSVEPTARESGGDSFSRALQSAHSERQAAPASRDSAKPPTADRGAESKGSVAPPPKQPASPLASRAHRADNTVPAQVRDKATDKLNAESEADPREALSTAVAGLDLQSLDTPAREALSQQLLTLAAALRRGELELEEAVESLRGVLQAQNLELDEAMQVRLQALMENAGADSEEPASALLVLLDGLQRQLRPQMTTAEAAAVPLTAPVRKAVAAEQETKPLARDATMETGAGRTRDTAVASQSASVFSAETRQSSGEEKSAVSLKETAAALPQLETAIKKMALGEGESRLRDGGDKQPLASALLGDKGIVVPAGLQSAQASTAAAAPVPTERGFTVQTMVNTLVGQPNWGQAVGQKVMWLAQQKIAEAQLRLDPPDLGPVKVKISVQNEQAQVVFTSHSPAVREALDQNAQRLRELFAEQGLDLVNVDVSDDRQQETEQGETAEQHGLTRGAGTDNGEAEGGETPQWVMEGQLTLVDHYA